jgi:hypothetical protein
MKTKIFNTPKTNKHLRLFIQFLFFISLVAAIFACKKDPASPAKVPYSIRMTDAPAPYSEVNIDLQGIELTGSGNNGVLLSVNPGIYNLLDFANGIDTLIATGSLNAGTVSQIRLILGPNNSVKIGNTTYPLATPSAQQSGLKLQVHQTLQAGVAYSVLLDFDANQSVVDQGNGSYSLKPVIRTIENAISGSIKGKISPAASATVTASAGGISYSTVVDANGEFILQGLPAGTYSLTITPVSPYTTVNMTNITVTVGNTTNVGLINV